MILHNVGVGILLGMTIGGILMGFYSHILPTDSVDKLFGTRFITEDEVYILKTELKMAHINPFDKNIISLSYPFQSDMVFISNTISQTKSKYYIDCGQNGVIRIPTNSEAHFLIQKYFEDNQK